MILVTVGTQIPFDRLIRAVDEIAPNLGMPAFAQTGISSYTPRNIPFMANLKPAEFEAKFKAAQVIVAHAGIGTVLGALRHKKPIVIVPRRASFGEHRNDHQLATCEQLRGRPGIYVAETESELETILSDGMLVPPDEALVAERRAHFADQLNATLAQLTGQTRL